MTSYKTLEYILAGLMKRYQERVPEVPKILSSMINEGLISKGDDIENDHIAFRTLGVPHLGIQSLEKIFLEHGYERRDSFYFETKKLNAYWYSPPEPRFPRVFISELIVPKLSQNAGEIIGRYTKQITADPVTKLNLSDGSEVDNYLHTSLWEQPLWEEYEELLKESEYAAWAIYNRYYLNHYTISVHNLPAPYNSIDHFNTFLEKHGIVLNDSGGKIKVSADGLLLQSSTVAEVVPATFKHRDGTEKNHDIAGSYIEFAERRVLPEFKNIPENKITREHRRDGFEVGNADKIFESTFTDQLEKR